MSRAVDIVTRRAAQIAQDRQDRLATAPNPQLFEAPPNQNGLACCARCTHGHMRSAQVGIFTIHFGKPELRCGVDGAFRSPELMRDCARHERK